MSAARTRQGRAAVRSGIAWLAVIAGVLLGLLAGGAPASAHSQLVESTPADGAVVKHAPETVTLRFNEPVQVVADATRLLSAGGGSRELAAQAVDETVTITLPDDLSDGPYTVAYRIVSADGHPVAGTLSLSIGTSSGTAPAPEPDAADGTAPDGTTPAADTRTAEVVVAVLTAVQYLGLLLMAGLQFFRAVVVRGPTPGRRPLRRLQWAGYGVAAVGAALLIPADGARVTGRQAYAFDVDTVTLTVLPLASWLSGVSTARIVQALAVIVLGLLVLVLSRTRPSRVALVCAGAVLATPVLVGHSQTVKPGWLVIPADLGHLYAGAFWLGGVVGLLVALRALHREATVTAGTDPAGGNAPDTGTVPSSDTGTGATTRALTLVERFSRWALLSVVVLAVSGILMAYLVSGSWSALCAALAAGGYGRLLLVKLCAVAVVVVLAGLNRLWLLPVLRVRPDPDRAWRGLRRVLGGEAAILVLVIGITGFLVNSAPPSAAGPADESSASGRGRGEASRPGTDVTPGTLHAESQGLVVDATVRPGTVGRNTMELRLSYRGSPVRGDRVTVTSRLPDQQLGPLRATVKPTSGKIAAQSKGAGQSNSATPAPTSGGAGAGGYRAALSLPVAGDWQVQITAEIDEFTQPIVRLPVTVR